jgi:hypothetical protein
VKKTVSSAIALFMLLALAIAPGLAQDTSTTNVNSVQIVYVACGDAGIMNVSGTLVAGWDIYYQLFDSGNGAGNALSSLRQLSVDGTYAVSERLTYANAATLATGATGSARVLIAREGNASSIDFQTTVNDVQDGCGNPQFGAGSSLDTGTGSPTTQAVDTPARILSPLGGFLNSNLQPEGDVFVGARPSDNFRSDVPGLIFAECDSYELANPGLIYDNDTVTVFWSWFTRTAAQMQQHLATAQYSVKLNGAPFTNASRSEPGRRGGANTWVFYTAPVGNLRPGHYEIEYKLSWTEPHFDGYDNYGPGTPTPFISTRCNFDVTPNPTNQSVAYSGEYFPTDYAVHELFPSE